MDSASEREAIDLYREVLRSLHDGTTVYLIDDYLSTIESVRRNPTRCGSDTVHLTVEGVDHSRSLTYLLSTKATYLDPTCVQGKPETKKGGSCLASIAARSTTCALAMKILSRNSGTQPPIDVSFILFGEREEKGNYQYLNVQSLREALLVESNSTNLGTHLILIESTGLRVCSVQKGCLVFRLDAEGHPHSSAFPWLGETSLEASVEFRNSLDEFMKPKHELYPLAFGTAPSATLSSFLIGYPTAVTTQSESGKHDEKCGSSSLMSEYYVSLPPEFSHEELERRLSMIVKEVAGRSGCTLSIKKEYFEEPFREDPRSLVVSAISKAFVRLTGFEPIFEWLPYPISAKDLKSGGFAKDLVAFGPGDWTGSIKPNEKGIIKEILQAANILARVPYEENTPDENLVPSSNR